MTNFSPDLPTQHAWTHRPKAEGGTDPIEFPTTAGFTYKYAIAGFGNDRNVIAQNTNDGLIWDGADPASGGVDFFSSDHDVLGDAPGAWDGTTVTIPGVYVYSPGFYQVSYNLRWQSGPADYPRASWLGFSEPDTASFLVPMWGQGAAVGTSSSISDKWANNTLGVTPLGGQGSHTQTLVWLIDDPTGVNEDRVFGVSVRHTYGGDQNFLGSVSKLVVIKMSDI